MKNAILLLSLILFFGCNEETKENRIETGNVIFIHPDGTALNKFYFSSRYFRKNNFK